MSEEKNPFDDMPNPFGTLAFALPPPALPEKRKSPRPAEKPASSDLTSAADLPSLAPPPSLVPPSKLKHKENSDNDGAETKDSSGRRRSRSKSPRLPDKLEKKHSKRKSSRSSSKIESPTPNNENDDAPIRRASRLDLTPEEIKEMAQMKSKFANQKQALNEKLPNLAKNFQDKANELVASYLKEIESLLKQQNVSDKTRLAVETYEKSRLAGIPALFDKKETTKCVVGVVAEHQFGKISQMDAEKKIIYCQALIRGWLVRKRFKKLANSVKKRERAAKEILTTERSYVDGLEKMMEYFVKPLQALCDTQKQLISREDIKKIFSNTELLHNMHKELLVTLEETLGGDKYNAQTTMIGDIFVKLGPFFKLYQQYVNNYEVALTHFTNLKNNNVRFAQFLAEVQKTPSFAGLDLVAFLIMPVQRIPRYEMLLKELNKTTATDHVDKENIVKAVDLVKQSAQQINEGKRKAESSSRMVTISQNLTGGPKNFNLFQPHRRFVSEMNMLVSEDARPRPIVVYLFNDILIIGRSKSTFAIQNVANALVGDQFRYGDFVQMKKLIRLTRCKVEFTNAKQIIKGVVLKWGERYGKTLTIYADKPTQVVELHTKLTETIEKLKKTLSSGTLRGKSIYENIKEFDDEVDVSSLENKNNSSNESSQIGANRVSALQKGKLSDVLKLYDEALKLETSLFAVPIDLKQLWPKYEKTINKQMLQHIRGRVNLLKQNLAKLDEQHDRVVFLLKTETLAVQLERSLVAGVDVVGKLREHSEDKAVVLEVMEWYLHTCRIWQDIVDIDLK